MSGLTWRTTLANMVQNPVIYGGVDIFGGERKMLAGGMRL